MDELPIVYVTGQNKYQQFKTLVKPQFAKKNSKTLFQSKFESAAVSP